MNLPAHPLLRRWLTLGATLAGCLAIVRAASVGPSGYANDFSTQPSAADWSFLNVAGAGTDITTAAGMDAAVELLTAGGITSQAVADTGNPPALNGNALWSSTGFYLQTRPTGDKYIALMATLVNNSGSDVGTVNIGYDFAKVAAAVEEVEGHRAYWSLTGAANSWTAIPAFCSATPGRLTASLSLLWPSGGTLYLLWADDNGSPSPDTACQIDNFSVTVASAAQVPVTLITQPTNQTVSEALPASFSALAGGNPAPTYQWYRNGAVITGATNNSYTLAMPLLSDNGSLFSVVAANVASNISYSVTSSVATLTVLANTNPLVVLRAVGAFSPLVQNSVQVTFSRPILASTATNTGNYVITSANGPLLIYNATLLSDQTNVTLLTSSQTPAILYTLTVNGIRDATTNAFLIATNSQATFTNSSFSLGYIRRQLYYNISGTAVANLTSSANYPNSPDLVDYPTSMGWPQENIADNYGGRFSGYLVPSVTGTYTFGLRSDDASQLFLSTNDLPANEVLLTSEPGCCEAFDAHVSAPITLVAGRQYYIEALMKEGGGGDYLYVGWKTPLDPANWVVIPGSNLGEYYNLTNSTITIQQQPASATNSAGLNQAATFSIMATGYTTIGTNLTYQWLSNATIIPGANGASYTTPVVYESDNGTVYSVVVSVPGLTVLSSNATLTVLRDIYPPLIAAAYNGGLTNVYVTYSERVASAIATNIANYSISPGLTIYAATMSDVQTVMLRVAPLALGSNYTITVNNVQDVAGIPNTIATNSQVTFTASAFVPVNIGGAIPPGSFLTISNGVNATAGGTGIGGISDQCQFNYNYQVQNGDFDVLVRLQGLALSSPWAKAGLMARATINSNSPFAGAFSTPGLMGSFFETRTTVDATASLSGSFPINYPNGWLRLQRVGNVFSGYAGFDGVNWTLLGTNTLPAGSYYVGLAATSYNTNQATLAQFRDYGIATNATITTAASPYEPLGPCSRRTGYVISEIMYKPAPRADSNNIEYIELFNSYPYWGDISGYHITGGSFDYTFPANTIIQGGGFIVIAASPSSIQNVYGITNVMGPYTGSLKKTGIIQFNDKAGANLLEIPYSNLPPWPVAADGTGHSIVMAKPTYGEADGRAWAISDVVGGSPGGYDAYHPSPLRNVVINEILCHSGTNLDYIELYNHSSNTVDISGCVLTDDAATNKFIIPTMVLPPRGFVSFDQNQMGFGLSAAGETIFFKNPEGSRILDVLAFEPQALGVSYGRWPDGASDFYPLIAPTPGASNTNILINDIVINEIMYSPISGNDDDGYVELYNKGTNVVVLDGWQLSGLSGGNIFTIPANTSLQPDGYLVLARNMANLFAKYTNLNTQNTVGDYSGHPPHGGGRLTLAMPDNLITTNNSGVLVTNSVYVVVEEVTFGSGGRWGQWSGGSGSSLELINPNSNHRLAYNWADSDETTKSAWTNLEYTGVLDNGTSYNGAVVDLVQIGLLDVGECLVDNIEVLPGGPTGSPNYISNPTFETGLTGWTPQGAYIRSGLDTILGGYQSGAAMRLRASDRVWTLFNSVLGALNNTTLASGQTATLRLKARWLWGTPEIMMRLRGNWLEVTGTMPVPTNLGSPGQRNSRYVTNAGPAIYEVKHSPAIPMASQPVVVTARFHDVHGVIPTLLYRIDTVVNHSPTYTTVNMVDDGTGGDAIAGDGIYSATIPAQASGTIVAFLVRAQDSFGAAAIFPADMKDGSGVPRECVIGFGDTIPTGSFKHHHVWMTMNWSQRWSDLGGLSNEMLDGTFVDGGGRIIYNWVGRYAGSPYHQYTGSPVTTVSGEHWSMPGDDLFLGTTSFNKQHLPGNGPLDDDTLMREQTSWWMARQIGLPWENRRYYVLYVNGNRHGPVMEDSQVPNADTIKENWPNETGGWLYKNMGWFEGDTGLQPNGSMNFTMPYFCTLAKITTTINGVPNQYKTGAYRWPYQIHQYPDSANNFTNVFNLITTANVTANPALVPDPYYAGMEALVDTEQWMRMSAIEHATGDWDSFFTQNQWNMYIYKAPQGKWHAMKWDWNITLGSVGWGSDPGNLFNVGSGDPVMRAFQTYPAYLRAMLRAYKDISNLAMNNACVDSVLDAKYAAFVANGLTSVNYGVIPKDPGTPGGLKSWIGTMHNSLLSALASQGVANVSFQSGSPAIVSNNLLKLTGVAPVEIKTVIVNGVLRPVSWVTVTNWALMLPANPGTNLFTVVGLDGTGAPVVGATNQVTFVYNGPAPSPVGTLVINEIMAAPAVSGAEYVELYNASTNFIYDLSGWDFSGLGYSFPAGSYVMPRAYLVLVKDRVAFTTAYGSSTTIFDQYNGNLQANGETLRLIKPGATSNLNVVVDEVKYDSAMPWPSATNGLSLQLIDGMQDNARVSNWAAAAPTPSKTNSVAGTVPPYPLLWINEVQPNNPDGYQDNTGSPQPWVELFNSGTNSISLEGLSLATTYTNLGEWAFPTGVVVGAGGFLVVFADGHPELSTGRVLHTSFLLAPARGSIVLSRGAQILDYINYANMQAGFSYGSWPDGQLIDRQYFYVATPGGSNDPTAVPIAINEWMASNTRTLLDSSTSKYSDWFELYNFGSTAVDLSGYYLTDTLGTKNKWQIPNGIVMSPHAFLLCWADKDSTPNGTNTAGNALHVNFKLSKAGTSIGLFGPGGQQVDAVTFGSQFTDISQGRFPDGTTSIYYLTNATPGAPNRISANDPPVVAAIGDKTINAGLLLTFAVVAMDSDLPAQTLTYRLDLGSPAGASINPVTGVFTWTPTLAPGAYPVTFRVTDNGEPSLSTTQAITINVTSGALNNPPVLASLLNRTVNELSLLLVTNSAYDPDGSSQTLTFSLDAGTPDGMAIDAATGLISWTPTEAQGPGTYPVTVRVTDNGTPPLSDAKTFTVFVNEVNTPPQLSFPSSWLVHAGDFVTFTAVATDSDLPPQILTFSLDAGAPAGAAINPVTGVFTWTPPDSAGGTNVMTVRVTDRGTPSASAFQSLVIVVVPAAPSSATITPANPVIAVNSNITLYATATGAGLLSYQWRLNGTNLPGASTGSTFTLVNAQLTDAGAYSVVVANLGGSVTSVPVSLAVLQAPAFTLQPQSQSVWNGSNATFRVTLSGDGPISLQWTCNGTNLPNATNSTLTLTNVRPTVAGSYQVRAANLVAAAVSDPATLVVLVPLTITSQPLTQSAWPYTNVTLAFGVSGSVPISYQWRLGATNLPGATNATLVNTNVLPTAAGNYTVIATNSISAVTSVVATLTVFTNPLILTQPLGRSAMVGSNANFSVVATSTSPLRYQWFFNTNTTISGATNDTLTYTNVQTSNYGWYNVRVYDSFGSTWSDAAQMADKLKPTITQQPTPTNSVILLGAPFALSISAIGPAPLSFRWRRSGTTVTNMIQNETNSTYYIPTGPFTNLLAPYSNVNVGFTYAGIYDVVVTNVAGNAPASSRASLAIMEPLTNRTARFGSNVTFTFMACSVWTNTVSAASALRYQWFFNSTNLLLSRTNLANMTLTLTNITLNLTNVQYSDEGPYTAVVTTSNGVYATQTAILTILRPPTISAQPTNQSLSVGDTAVFTVGATGVPSPGYQWWFNQTNLLAGATGPTLTLTNAQTLQAGGYSVVISNSVGAVTSQVAQLTVTFSEPPQLGNVVGPPAPGGLLQFTFDGVAGQSYTVLWREFLDQGNWQPLTNISLLGSSQPVLIQDTTAGQTQRFYRVVMPMRLP